MTAANKYPCRPHGTDGIRINDPGGSREGKGEKTGEDEMQGKKKMTCSQPRYVSVDERDIPVAEMTVTNGLDRRRTF